MTATANIRNIGIIAHIDAGKTSLSERILFYSHKIHRMGEVHDGTATMDFLPEEQERGITISSACTSCDWGNCLINLIDTPGHVDFSIEVERCLRVLDGAVGVFCAVGGVEPQSETVWKQSERLDVPKLAFINKLDRLGADFASTVTAMNTRLNANAVPVNIPLGSGNDFSGIIDLIDQETLRFDVRDQGATVTRHPMNSAEQELCGPWRENLLEQLAEVDDAFLELWMEQTFTSEHIRQALRKATLARKLTPVLCGSALRNIGVQPLLDAVCAYLPSPLDVMPADGYIPGSPEALSALVFKVLVEHGRKTSLIRIYSGALREGDQIFNVNRKQTERTGRLYRLHADSREQVQTASAGEIIATVGLRHTHTGATYTAPGNSVLLESIQVSPPVMTLSLEARNADEASLLDEALARFAEEDPTLLIQMDEDTGLRMLKGMGELHLAVVLQRLEREYGITPRVGQPQVVMRETTSREATADITLDKELGKEHHMARVALHVSPRPRGSGNSVSLGVFQEEANSKIFPAPLLDALREGINDALQCGVDTAWPVTDVAVSVTLVENVAGSITAPGCHMAALAATREALSKAKPKALEPLMRLEITTPESALGGCIALLTSCKGKVENIADAPGEQKLISALTPLRQTFGFSTSLRSATQGRAGFSLTFERFDLPS